MTVIVNEAAMAALFHSAEMRQEVEQTAQIATQLVVEKLTTGPDPLLHSYPGDVHALIDYSVEQDPQTVYAVVGVVDTGQRLARYVKSKEDREHKWFAATIEQMKV